jgi:hypothetical protein
MYGSRMKTGVHYDETYALVVSWNSVRMVLAMLANNNWCTKQIDYVLAYPQVPVEKTPYMVIPKCFEVEGGSSKDYLLQVRRNIYGQKQAGRVWNA